LRTHAELGILRQAPRCRQHAGQRTGRAAHCLGKNQQVRSVQAIEGKPISNANIGAAYSDVLQERFCWHRIADCNATDPASQTFIVGWMGDNRQRSVQWSSNFGHNNRLLRCHFLFVSDGRQIA
jgi:hypothetical protein